MTVRGESVSPEKCFGFGMSSVRWVFPASMKPETRTYLTLKDKTGKPSQNQTMGSSLSRLTTSSTANFAECVDSRRVIWHRIGNPHSTREVTVRIAGLILKDHVHRDSLHAGNENNGYNSYGR